MLIRYPRPLRCRSLLARRYLDDVGTASTINSPQMSEELVEVRRCTWLHEAQFLKSVLEAADIEAFIPDEYTLGVQPLYANVLDGVRLLVRAGDLERASEILDSETHKKDSNEG